MVIPRARHRFPGPLASRSSDTGVERAAPRRARASSTPSTTSPARIRTAAAGPVPLTTMLAQWWPWMRYTYNRPGGPYMISDRAVRVYACDAGSSGPA